MSFCPPPSHPFVFPCDRGTVQSVSALIDGIRAFEGGVVLVSHDARLISATECELWVCDGVKSNSGLYIERKGFAEYRKQVLKEIDLRVAAVEAQAAARAKRRQEERAARLARLQRRKSGGTGAGDVNANQMAPSGSEAEMSGASPPPVPSAEEQKKAVASVFQKKGKKGKKKA